MSYIKENIQELNNSIQQAIVKTGRKQEEVKLIAVSKTFPASVIPEAMDAGQTVFAENKVQEGEEKRIALAALDFQYHLIGHLQSNKVNKAIKYFDMIHSVDSVSLANKISEACLRENKKMPILLQINTSDEKQKSGISTNYKEIEDIIKQILDFQGVSLQGFMTMGPMDIDEKKTRECFQALYKIREDINKNMGLNLIELSMGMSHDFEWAIQEGSTMLRIGNAIFGKRDYQL